MRPRPVRPGLREARFGGLPGRVRDGEGRRRHRGRRLRATGTTSILIGLALLGAGPALAQTATSSAATTVTASAAAASPSTATEPAAATPVATKAAAPAPVAEARPPTKAHPDAPGLDRSGTPSRPPVETDYPWTHQPEPSAGPGVERPLPIYDGRPERGADAGEVLIWVPRALLLPAHLTLKYLVRWPLVHGLTLLEKHHIIDRTLRLFQFLDGRAGIYPTGFIDFDLSPSVGFVAYYDGAISPGDTLSVQGGFWTNDWQHIALRSTSRVFRDDSGAIRLLAEYTNRPDTVFAGIGEGSSEADRVFFRWRRFDLQAAVDGDLGGLSEASLSLAFRDSHFGTDGLEPNILTRNTLVDLRDRQGLVADYRLLTLRAFGVLDSRDEDRAFTAGSGLRLEAFGELSLDPTETSRAWIELGGEASAFLDLTGRNHVLGLAVFAQGLATLGDGTVPFTELPSLGGDRMRGFVRDRMRGGSAIAATLDYRYPIWSFLDADLFCSVGNTFGQAFEGFDLEKMFLSWGLGVRTNHSRQSSVDLLIAFGTTRFDQGASLDNVRIAFGFNHGF